MIRNAVLTLLAGSTVLLGSAHGVHCAPPPTKTTPSTEKHQHVSTAKTKGRKVSAVTLDAWTGADIAAMKKRMIAANEMKEKELNQWKPTAQNNHSPLPSICDLHADVSGTWVIRGGMEGSFLALTPIAPGEYRVDFSASGCLDRWSLKRTAHYSDGVLVLNRPVEDYCSSPYQRLYSVRVADESFLVADINVEEFQKALSKDGMRVVDMFPTKFYAFHQRTPAKTVAP